MANVPVNAMAVAISGSGSVTGSYAGFTTTQATTFTGLKDSRDNDLAAGGAMIFSAGSTVPLYVTSASISSGAVIFYL